MYAHTPHRSEFPIDGLQWHSKKSLTQDQKSKAFFSPLHNRRISNCRISLPTRQTSACCPQQQKCTHVERARFHPSDLKKKMYIGGLATQNLLLSEGASFNFHQHHFRNALLDMLFKTNNRWNKSCICFFRPSTLKMNFSDFFAWIAFNCSVVSRYCSSAAFIILYSFLFSFRCD